MSGLLALQAGLGLALVPSQAQSGALKSPETQPVFLTRDFPANFHALGEDESVEDLAVRTLSQAMGANADEFVLSSKVVSKHNGISHLYYHQVFNGLECQSCVAAVHVSRYGEVVSMSHSGLKDTAHRGVQALVGPANARVSAIEALQTLANYADVQLRAEALVEEPALSSAFRSVWASPNTYEDTQISATLSYALAGDNQVDLAWRIEWQTADGNHAFDSFVSASRPGQVIAHEDLVKWDSFAEEVAAQVVAAEPHVYNAYQIPALDPLLGERKVVNNPAENDASPIGWHNDQAKKYTTTAGNNAYSQENWRGGSSWESNYRPDGGSALNFNFPIDFSKEPREYADAAIANLHFWNNLIHDIMYLRGFDEVSGNFQETNFGKGGLGNDAVQANAQDGAGYNNANFMTPVDGQRPRMRMYLWNQVRPMIDGDLDSQIIVHEYMHGVSNRLTGGPQNVRCLGSGQAGGMGEGWGDWVANMFSSKREHTPTDAFPMGVYAAGRGIRPFPYSGSFEVNPQTYGYINDNHTLRLGYTWDSARHRQTGEVGLLQANGTPFELFPMDNPQKDASGHVLQKRDRLSYAILHQVSGEYRGEFLDGALVANVGIRAPFMKRNLNNYCFTTSVSGFVDCFAQDAERNEAYAEANPNVQGPQKRVKKYDDILPNLGLVYKIDQNTSVFANYSKGLQVPGTDNLYNAFFYADNTAGANPRPEMTDNFDLGARYRSGNIQAQASVWYTRYQDRLASAYDPELDRNVYRNLGRVDKYGIDGSISYQPIPQLALYVFGSYMKSEIKDNVLIDVDNNGNNVYELTAGKREGGAPAYNFGGSARALLGHVDLGVTAKRTGGRYLYDNNMPFIVGTGNNAYEAYGAKTNAYWLVNLDARVNLEFLGLNDKTFFQLNVYNLFDALYVGYYNSTLSQSSSALNAQIGAPRTISGTISVQF